MKEVVVVIPVYRENPTSLEVLSLKQGLTILGHYEAKFVGPHTFKIDRYFEIAAECGVNITIERFEDIYFKDISGYNRLLLSRQFYERFAKYKFMLIYQTDAYVFKDELKYWCDCGYDFIGAPWFEGFNNANGNSRFLGVGNGGFSLRNVQSQLKVLNSFRYIVPPRKLWINFRKNMTRGSFIQLLKDLTIQNNTFSRFNNFSDQEDFFWCSFVPRIFSWYKIPDVNTALKFSMEVNAPLLFKLNNNTLPFGCHAWEKYNPEFWSGYIKNS